MDGINKEKRAVSNQKLLLLALALLLLAILSGGVILLLNPSGDTVKVTVDGKVYGKYPLGENRTVVISPEDGSWHNTLQIQSGTASVIESDCTNQICVHTPALEPDTVGIIVCLPHGVAVEME